MGTAGDHFSLEGALELFKKSDSPEDFEKMLNKETNFVNNLDLNEDEEIDYIKEKQIRCYTAKELFERGIQEIMNEIISHIEKPVYLSLDIDVVDPVEAIGTGYLEHGGLSSRELIYALQQLKNTNKLAMIDLVEVNPENDIQDMTSKLAAKCIIELANY